MCVEIANYDSIFSLEEMGDIWMVVYSNVVYWSDVNIGDFDFRVLHIY